MPASSICPRCRTAMTRGSGDAAHCAVCSGCGGVWLEMAVAKAIGTALSQQGAEQAAALGAQVELTVPPAEAASDETLPCPVCGGNLGKHRFPPLLFEVDRCLTHGMFFDHGELAEVLLRTPRHGQVNRLYELDEAGAPVDPAAPLDRRPPPRRSWAEAGDKLVDDLGDRIERAVEAVGLRPTVEAVARMISTHWSG
jgi:Zn-finger nucleic acid-binding protein